MIELTAFILILVICLWTLINVIKNLHILSEETKELDRKLTVLDKISQIQGSIQTRLILEIKDDISPQDRGLLELIADLGEEE